MSNLATDPGPDDMSREELFDAYVDGMRRASLILHELRMQFRAKPVLGGCFGHGGFVIMSHWTFYSGLDEVTYYVAEASTRFVITRGETKARVLQQARMILSEWLTLPRLHAETSRHKLACAEFDAARSREREQFREESRAAEKREAIKSIPRRRKQIFDEGGGKCHYCATVLTLDGKWHIEHKMPKALGGGNEPGNLVASCVSCNHKKRDTTDVEFKARLARETTQ